MNQTDTLLKPLAVELPIIQAPMAGCSTPELVAAASNAGGLGSLACAMLSVDQVNQDSARIRSLSNRSFMLSFFPHKPPGDTAAQERAWQQKLAPYYKEFGAEPSSAPPAGTRR